MFAAVSSDAIQGHKAGRLIRKDLAIATIAVVCLLGCASAFSGVTKDAASSPEPLAADVLDATYTIERQAIRLVDGRSEIEILPGSATRIITSVFDRPIYGDLDGDGDDDAVLLLVHHPGECRSATGPS